MSSDPFIAEMRLHFAITNRNAHAIVPARADPPMEDIVEDLHDKDPDGYALLSEHIEIERYRDPRRSGR